MEISGNGTLPTVKTKIIDVLIMVETVAAVLIKINVNILRLQSSYLSFLRHT
jgi:hypothetical protein